MGIKRYHDGLLGRIANGMSAGATTSHRLELERIARRAEAACQFRDMLAELKSRLAVRGVLRNGCTFALAAAERQSLAA